MATIDAGGGRSRGGRRKVDAEISLVPFIDLLLCCVMFLLVTAVWNELGGLEAQQQLPSKEGTADEVHDRVRDVLAVRPDGFVLGSTAGERTSIPNKDGQYDLAALEEALADRKKLQPARRDLVVAPDDGVGYGAVVAAMDVAAERGFSALSVADGAMMP